MQPAPMMRSCSCWLCADNELFEVIRGLRVDMAFSQIMRLASREQAEQLALVCRVEGVWQGRSHHKAVPAIMLLCVMQSLARRRYFAAGSLKCIGWHL